MKTRSPFRIRWTKVTRHDIEVTGSGSQVVTAHSEAQARFFVRRRLVGRYGADIFVHWDDDGYTVPTLENDARQTTTPARAQQLVLFDMRPVNP